MRPIVLLLLLLIAASAGGAAIETFTFDTPAQEARFKALSGELRCLVCQNQSIADSNADLAKDLRREVYEMIKGGRGDAEIVDFLVARYGDFVLYRPPVKPITVALWVGPFVLIAIALILLLRFIRSRSAVTAAGDATLSDEQQARLDRLLDNRREASDT